MSSTYTCPKGHQFVAPTGGKHPCPVCEPSPGQLTVDECIERAMIEEEQMRVQDSGTCIECESLPHKNWCSLKPGRKSAWQQQEERPKKPLSAKDVVKRRLGGR